MANTPDEDGRSTRVGEWADLVGDTVPERARRERVLRGSGPRPDDDEDGDWPTTAR